MWTKSELIDLDNSNPDGGNKTVLDAFDYIGSPTVQNSITDGNFLIKIRNSVVSNLDPSITVQKSSSKILITLSSYIFAVTDGTSEVPFTIERQTNGGAWASVGTMFLGNIGVAPNNSFTVNNHVFLDNTSNSVGDAIVYRFKNDGVANSYLANEVSQWVGIKHQTLVILEEIS